MKKLIYLFAVAAILFTAPTAGALAGGEPVAIIVNKDNPIASISLSDIKKFYENDALEWPDGTRIVLYDLPVKNEARKTFSDRVLGKGARDVAMEWANRKITNTAKNPPLTLKSPVLTQARVGKNPSAIGYLPKSAVKSNKVKIVAIIE